MLKLPEFNRDEVDQVDNWLVQWFEWSREEDPKGRPDWTRSTIYQLPLVIALLKSESKLHKITWALIVLTVLLAVETLVLILRT